MKKKQKSKPKTAKHRKAPAAVQPQPPAVAPNPEPVQPDAPVERRGLLDRTIAWMNDRRARA